MGRQFGFAYGHKENGAMFSHMTVMYANALYKRGFVYEGHKVLRTIFNHIRNFNVSKCYPSIPEYFDPKGRAMYPYLTGSASWLLLTMIDQVFGVRIVKDKLFFEPKLCIDEFNNGYAAIKTKVINKIVNIKYVNENDLNYGEYKISQILINNKTVNEVIINNLNENDEIVVILND
jgi:cellobiose phosphorylase